MNDKKRTTHMVLGSILFSLAEKDNGSIQEVIKHSNSAIKKIEPYVMVKKSN